MPTSIDVMSFAKIIDDLSSSKWLERKEEDGHLYHEEKMEFNQGDKKLYDMISSIIPKGQEKQSFDLDQELHAIFVGRSEKLHKILEKSFELTCLFLFIKKEKLQEIFTSEILKDLVKKHSLDNVYESVVLSDAERTQLKEQRERDLVHEFIELSKAEEKPSTRKNDAIKRFISKHGDKPAFVSEINKNDIAKGNIAKLLQEFVFVEIFFNKIDLIKNIDEKLLIESLAIHINQGSLSLSNKGRIAGLLQHHCVGVFQALTQVEIEKDNNLKRMTKERQKTDIQTRVNELTKLFQSFGFSEITESENKITIEAAKIKCEAYMLQLRSGKDVMNMSVGRKYGLVSPYEDAQLALDILSDKELTQFYVKVYGDNKKNQQPEFSSESVVGQGNLHPSLLGLVSSTASLMSSAIFSQAVGPSTSSVVSSRTSSITVGPSASSSMSSGTSSQAVGPSTSSSMSSRSSSQVVGPSTSSSMSSRSSSQVVGPSTSSSMSSGSSSQSVSSSSSSTAPLESRRSSNSCVLS